MLKSDLNARLAKRFPELQEKSTVLAVSLILDAMQAALASGGRIEIRDFGSFGVNPLAPRIGRNPKTGQQVFVPAKYRPHFKPGKALRERVACAQGSRGADLSFRYESVAPSSIPCLPQPEGSIHDGQ